MKKTGCLRFLAASLLVTGLVAIFGTSLLLAQSAGTGGLTGTVTDPSGAVLPKVTVTATDLATGQARTATTGTAGAYRFSLLPPGNYKLTFSVTGFKTAEVPSVTVNVTEIPVVNQKLQIGTQTEQVTVQAGAEEIQTATSTLGGFVGGQTISALPLTNRNYTQILSLSAGATGSVNNAAALGRGTNNMSVNGNDTGSNNLQMDGAPINNWIHTDTNDDGFYASGVGIPQPDAIQEFMVQTSTFDASYGRNPGANINVVTKSGTNQLHGTAFEFFRNADLNASEYFSKSNLMNQNQFGGVIGGPIKKDKIFFFGGYQGTRQSNGIAIYGHGGVGVTDLTDNRTAAGIATAVDPDSGIEYCQEIATINCSGGGVDPVALNILNLKGGPGGGYLLPSNTAPQSYLSPATFTEDQVIGNVDFLLTPKNTLLTRFFYSRDPQFQPFPNFPNSANSGLGEPVTMKYFNDNDVVKLTSVLSNTFTNEVRASFQRMNGDGAGKPVAGSSPADLGFTPITPGITDPPLFWLGIGGTTASLFSGFVPAISPVNQYQLADQIAWSHHAHTLRAGYEAEKIQHNFNFEGLQRGWLWFLGLSDFITGQPFACEFCSTGPQGGVQHYYRLNGDSVFVQDDWRVNSRLTVNMGVRWEYFGQPTDKRGELTDINPALFNTVATPTAPETSGAGLVGYVVPANYPTSIYGPVPAGVQQTSTNYSYGNPPKSNFAPRIGFAWRPTSSDKLVVRAGFGIFYDRVSEDEIVHGLEQGPPYSSTLDYMGPGNGHTLEAPFASTFSYGQWPSRWSNMTCAPDGTDCTYLTTNGEPGEIAGEAVAPGTGYSALGAPYLDAKIESPLVRQYNVDIQYEFAPTFVLEAAYVGSSEINGINQYQDEDIPGLASPTNPINGQTANTQANIPLRLPILGYSAGGLTGCVFDGIMNYNSLQLTLRKRFSHGLQMQAAYTFSKSLTDLQHSSSNFEFGSDINNPVVLSDSYGPAPQNIPQRFVVNYQYDLPFGHHSGALGEIANGWNLSGVTVAQKGFPLTVMDSSGASIYGINTSTAQLCSGVSPHQMLASGSMMHRVETGYFNPAAFCSVPTIGDGTGFGNSPVGAILGPGQFNWDMALNKEFKITETKSFVFRPEAYNLFNHTQFANPSYSSYPSLTDQYPGGPPAASGQGIITATSVNPRLIQLSFKFQF